MDKKQLLVLDINGLLCIKIDKNKNQTPIEELINLNSYYVKIRPYCIEFLQWCFDNYKVAIYTSTTKTNSENILKNIIPKDCDLNSFFEFRWYRDKVKLDPDYGKCSEIDKYDTIKDLNDIYYYTYFNREYGPHNTILCDDSMMKTRFIETKNLILVETYDPLNDNDDALLKLKDIIKNKFLNLTKIYDIRTDDINDFDKLSLVESI